MTELQVKERAQFLHEDIQRFGIEGFSIHNNRGIIEYQLGKTGYSVDNAQPKDAPHFFPSGHGGTQLSHDNILFFVRASEIARRVVPELWTQPNADILGGICSARQHTDTLRNR